ncbi:MAG: DUF4402 domain-containing protein [Sphingobium sp.]
MVIKNLLLTGVLAGTILLSGQPALGQTMTTVQDLSFGAFVAGEGGTVTISPHGTRTGSGDVTLITGGQFSQGGAAAFDLLGTPNALYQIMLPSDGSVKLTGSRGGIMSLSAFTSSPAETSQLNQLGNQTLLVGATLVVSSNQTAGSYSGSFSVTVVFQ